MNCGYFDFLIDKALEIKDFEWVEELKSQQNRYKDDSYLVEADNNTDVALEDIVNRWCVLTEDGIVNLDFKGRGITLSNLILVEKKGQGRKGELLNYRYASEDEKGAYLSGYSAGEKDVIRQAEIQSIIANSKKWWQFWK